MSTYRRPKTGEEWYRQNYKCVNFPEGNLVWFERCWDEAIKFAKGAKNTEPPFSARRNKMAKTKAIELAIEAISTAKHIYRESMADVGINNAPCSLYDDALIALGELNTTPHAKDARIATLEAQLKEARDALGNLPNEQGIISIMQSRGVVGIASIKLSALDISNRIKAALAAHEGNGEEAAGFPLPIIVDPSCPDGTIIAKYNNASGTWFKVFKDGRWGEPTRWADFVAEARS